MLGICLGVKKCEIGDIISPEMCLRFALIRAARLAAELAAMPMFPEFDEWIKRPHYNIPPSSHIPIVRVNHDGQRIIDMAQWGFIPLWTKGVPKVKPGNAKAESVATSGMFRRAFNQSRCLIPADGFYEWQGKTPPRQPYFVHFKDDRLFAFAGLCEKWKPEPDAAPILTCTLITTTPNDLMQPIHNRMPVIVDTADYARWLDRDADGAVVSDLMKPWPTDELEARKISTRVNKVQNDGPELLE